MRRSFRAAGSGVGKMAWTLKRQHTLSIYFQYNVCPATLYVTRKEKKQSSTYGRNTLLTETPNLSRLVHEYTNEVALWRQY